MMSVEREIRMGLFSQPPGVDSDLAKLLIAEDPVHRRNAEKALAKSQHAIPTLLEVGEEVRAIAHKAPASSEVVLLTNRRLIWVKKGKRRGSPSVFMMLPRPPSWPSQGV